MAKAAHIDRDLRNAQPSVEAICSALDTILEAYGPALAPEPVAKIIRALVLLEEVFVDLEAEGEAA
jgi:hypothetical protein